MLCMAFFFPRMPLSEQGIWQRRGLSLGRFLSIFILGFRVLYSFSFRCSWYLVATGFMLWTVSFGTLFWSNLLSVTASFVVCSCLLPWCFSFASWGLHGFLLLRSSSVRLWCSLVGWYGHEVVDCVIHISKTKSVVLRLHIIFSGDVIYNFPLQS